jgi:hypothetical protein
MKKHATAYWLLPAKAERELFCEIIRILFKQFDGPNFEPHITLLVTGQNRPTPKEVLQKVTGAPVRLKVRGTAFSSKFTKTLFVQFKSSAALKALVVNLGRVTKSRRRSLTDPHLSLVYKPLPVAVKSALAAVIRLPFREVLFDSIQAVHLTLPVGSRADVEAWRIVAKKSLRR